MARNDKSGATTVMPLLFLMSGLLIPLGVPMAANAQEGTDALSDTETIEEVLVTGSRILREDGSRAPSPMTVVGADYFDLRGSMNIANALNELPAFRGSTTPASTTNKTLNPRSELPQYT